MDSSHKGSDTTSESETYSDRLELLAESLGLDSINDLHHVRIQVSRRRLEAMISGEDETEGSAESFFQSIMEETNTHINWPRRMKVGARSKKDPFVLVMGLHSNVMEAKAKITEVLHSSVIRVIMKIDVSYVHHSQIIGKEGTSIKNVMEITGCRIHFPDSNRFSSTEKSNVVSISGSMPGLEKARASIRALTPLVFCFDLPIVGAVDSQPDPNSPYLLDIQEKYKVTVNFRAQAKLHSTQVVIKGCEREVKQVKEATMLLVSHMCGTLASQVKIQMSVQVSPQNVSIIVGHNWSTIEAIMRNTSTQIMVPDVSDPNIPLLKKGNITITGSIHSVYLARNQLLGSLPLVLIISLPEDVRINMDNMENIMQTLDVAINTRYRPKQRVLKVYIKGVERNATNVYEARRILLELDEPKVNAEIPESYIIPNLPPVLSGMKNDCQPMVKVPHQFPTLSPAAPPCQTSAPSSPLLPPTLSVPWLKYGLVPLINTQAQQQKQLHHLLNPFAPSTNSSGYGSVSSLNSMQSGSMESNNYSALSSLTGSLPTSPTESGRCTPSHSPLPTLPSKTPHCSALNSLAGLLSKSPTESTCFTPSQLPFPPSLPQNQHCSALNSLASLLSTTSTESSCFAPSKPPFPPPPPQNQHYSALGSLASLLSKSQTESSSFAHSQLPFSSSLPQNQRSPLHKSPGYEREVLKRATLHGTSLEDYEQKKLLAFRAMQQPPDPSEVRVPTTAWAGYGFSQSSPVPELQQRDSFLLDDYNTYSLWQSSPGRIQRELSSPNKWNTGSPTSTTSPQPSGSHRVADIVELLTSLGLEKYIRLFQEHEVDLSTFKSLNEKDLQEMGVTAHGARHKLLAAIKNMKECRYKF